MSRAVRSRCGSGWPDFELANDRTELGQDRLQARTLERTDPLPQVVEILKETLRQLARLRDRIVEAAPLELLEAPCVARVVLPIDRAPADERVEGAHDRVRVELEAIRRPEPFGDDVLGQPGSEHPLVLVQQAHDPLVNLGVLGQGVPDDRLLVETAFTNSLTWRPVRIPPADPVHLRRGRVDGGIANLAERPGPRFQNRVGELTPPDGVVHLRLRQGPDGLPNQPDVPIRPEQARIDHAHIAETGCLVSATARPGFGWIVQVRPVCL